MDFPIADLMDQDACYQKLLGLLHPAGLARACPAVCTHDRPQIAQSPEARTLRGLSADAPSRADIHQ
jgi:hypothetical protein